MNHIARHLLLLGLLLPVAAQAATTVELKITGVIKPGACQPTLSGNIDYGVLPSDWSVIEVSSNPAAAAQKLQHAEVNSRRLESRQVVLTINCTAAMPVAIVVKDNHAASKMTGLANKSGARGATEASMFSLDATGDVKHGAFHLAMTSASAGGAAVDVISAPLIDTAQWGLAPG